MRQEGVQVGILIQNFAIVLVQISVGWVLKSWSELIWGSAEFFSRKPMHMNAKKIWQLKELKELVD
jgi:hypothetical protein